MTVPLMVERPLIAAVLAVIAWTLAWPMNVSAQERRRSASDTLPLYFEFQVEETARVVTWTTPQYPKSLRAQKVEGEVVLQFVVDTAGQMERQKLRILRSTHADFSDAVLATLSTARFTPAIRNSRRVRQLMEQPFVFSQKP